jgi:hypothetical protein
MIFDIFYHSKILDLVPSFLIFRIYVRALGYSAQEFAEQAKQRKKGRISSAC